MGGRTCRIVCWDPPAEVGCHPAKSKRPDCKSKHNRVYDRFDMIGDGCLNYLTWDVGYESLFLKPVAKWSPWALDCARRGYAAGSPPFCSRNGWECPETRFTA